MNLDIYLDHDDMQKILNGEKIIIPAMPTLKNSQNIILKPNPDERWTGGLNGPISKEGHL